MLGARTFKGSFRHTSPRMMEYSAVSNRHEKRKWSRAAAGVDELSGAWIEWRCDCGGASATPASVPAESGVLYTNITHLQAN